jgi:hypothetical protein
MHTDSDLRVYLAWCAERHLEPLAVRRAHVEMYVRWLQEVRRFRPSTVSRRLSVVAGFYRTCVIDGILERASDRAASGATSTIPIGDVQRYKFRKVGATRGGSRWILQCRDRWKIQNSKRDY